ncbi:MAG: DUF1638 domain-containing protein [Rhizobiales bacterium]|nr:DUF1638 domain-containing protein [Hyphomicrobiales bacterium]
MTIVNNITNQSKTRIIACGMIAREVLAINAQLGDVIDLQCLPAEYHFSPQKIAPALDLAITQAKAEGFKNIFIGYADCGSTGAIDKICDHHQVSRVDGPHCFAFYMGNVNFKEQDGDFVTTFFITDFLARNFETFLIKPLGLDKHPELKEVYFGNYTRALYLAQSNDLELEKQAKLGAAFLGLDYQKQYTGFGDLAPALKQATASK